MMRNIGALAIVLLLVQPHLARAQASCPTLASADLDMLEKMYTLGDIRVFYTEKAPPEGAADHRLVEQSRIDGNGNGVPDFVENVAKQADVARRAFASLGFMDPLASMRYGQVSRIDINILDMAQNGLAYDNPVRYQNAPNRGDACTLRIDVSSRLEAQGQFTINWFVLAHEVFHLFPNGYTQFKRSWVSEPTAKWAEYALRSGGAYPLQKTGYVLPAITSYLQQSIIPDPNGTDAYQFWSRMAELTGARQELPESLAQERYTDGQPALKDRVVHGADMVIRVYQGLDTADDAVSRENGWDPYAWPETEQKLEARDARILGVVQAAVGGTASDEVRVFLSIQP